MSSCEALATKAEVAQLRQTVALLAGQMSSKLDKNERSGIIQEAIQQSKSQLLPPIQRAENRAGEALAGIGALGITVGTLGGRIGQNSAAIARLFALFAGFPNQFKAIVLSILAALGLYALAGNIQEFINRVSRLESRFNILSSSVNAISGGLNSLRTLVYQVSSVANSANSRALLAYELAHEFGRRANRAVELANIATTLANLASLKADGAASRANTAIQKADSAYALSILAGLQAQSTRSIANTATQRANTAYSQAMLAGLQARSAASAANTATQRANAAAADADRAAYLAENATYIANSASRRANIAIERANKALAGINGNVQRTEQLNRDARSGNIFRTWNARVWEPTIINRTIQQSTIVQPISIQQASRNFDRQRAQLQADIRNAIVISNPLATSSNTTNRAIAELRGQVAVNTQGIGVLQNTKADRQTVTDISTTIGNIAGTVAGTITRVGTLEGQARANEVANQTIGTAIANLPTVLAQNPTYQRAIADATKVGSCEAMQPTGCSGGLLGGISDAIQGLINDYLNNLYPSGEPVAEGEDLYSLIQEILDRLNNLETGGGTGEPADNTEIINKLNRLSEVIGIDDYPASLPESLITQDNLEPGNVSIPSLTQLMGWYIQRFDEVLGQWEIPIEIKDSDPTTPGDQQQTIKLPNVAEYAAESFTLAFQSYTNTELLLNIVTRILIETGMDKQQNFSTFKLVQSLTDWAGFKQKDMALDMPLTFTLNKTRYDEILKESIVKVNCVEFDDKFGLEADLMRFREAAGILQAVYKRKLDPNGDIKGQILEYLLGTFRGVNKVNDTEESFEEFITQVENGFTDIPSVGDPTQPYGRPFTQRPKIRNLSDLDEET